SHTLQGEVHDECAYYTMGGVSGHAGLFASAGDLARLCSLMLDGTYQGKRYFTDEVLDEFSAPVAPEYPGQGIGWMRRGEDGSNTVYFGENSPTGIIGHQGWTGTLTMIDRENKLILVFLSNKINSPVTRNQYAPDMFDGKWYTTGFGEFIAPMIYAALSAEDETDAKRAVCREFDDCIRILGEIKDAVYALTDDHPANLAYQAICQAKKNFIEAQK
ncbi:MAG: serine hydrolase, partial [Clostridia bacterium]|nr:serine hydrolase [Clostridia bacterium]